MFELRSCIPQRPCQLICAPLFIRSCAVAHLDITIVTIISEQPNGLHNTDLKENLTHSHAF